MRDASVNELDKVMVSDFVLDINYLKSFDISYWVHKTQDSDGYWLLTNFNYNITNHNLKTKEFGIAKQRARIIINSKRSFINKAINNLTLFTKKINRKEIHANHTLSHEIIKFTDNLIR